MTCSITSSSVICTVVAAVRIMIGVGGTVPIVPYSIRHGRGHGDVPYVPFDCTMVSVDDIKGNLGCFLRKEGGSGKVENS